MTGSLDRDALLQRLRDDPPEHLRALHALGDAGATNLLPGILGVIMAWLDSEPKNFTFEDTSLRLQLFLGSRENHSGATCTHHQLLTTLVWWLIIEELSSHAEATVWEGGTYAGWHEVDGDLIVEGDLELQNAELFVAGDVYIRGSLTYVGASNLVTGGGVHATRAIVGRSGAMYAGGRVEAPLTTFMTQDDGLLLMRGVCAVVFIEERSPGWSPSAPEAAIARTQELSVGAVPGGRRVERDVPEVEPGLGARFCATLHPDVTWAMGVNEDTPMGYGWGWDWHWDTLWSALFESNLPLEQRLLPNAMEVFRNQCNGMTR